MQTKTLYNGEQISVIGQGTWGLGGGMTRDDSQDDMALRAIRDAIELGYTHIDTAEMYGRGHAEELVDHYWGGINYVLGLIRASEIKAGLLLSFYGILLNFIFQKVDVLE